MTDTTMLEKKEKTIAGVKLFCSVQLIYENAKLAQLDDTPQIMKVLLNKLRFDCGKINKLFWKHLSVQEEEVFQEKLRQIEKILEE